MRFDVILVLAGGITNRGILPPNVCRRVQLTKELFDQEAAENILMSGLWSRFWEHTPPQTTEAALMAEYAISLGIPKEKIFLEEHSHNTFENIFLSKKLFFEPQKWKKILVITSDFHVPRVQLTLQTLLDNSYTYQVLGANVNVGVFKHVTLYTKEKILLHTDWFFQYFTHRSY